MRPPDNLKKVSLELGGKSPNVVFEDADVEAAIPGPPAPSSSITDNAAVPDRGSSSKRSIFDKVVDGVAERAQKDQPRARHGCLD